MTIKDFDISEESLEHFILGMTITDVAFYTNPRAIHLFLSPASTKRTTALLTVTADDDTELVFNLQGLHNDS